jgi:hypothetical protein
VYFLLNSKQINVAGPYKLRCSDELKESGIIGDLFTLHSEEQFDGSHISSEDSQENDSNKLGSCTSKVYHHHHHHFLLLLSGA